MEQTMPIISIGLMSGTSMDGIDAAMVRTDGAGAIEPIANLSIPYPPEFRRELRSVLGGGNSVDRVAETLTKRHADAVGDLLKASSVSPDKVSVLGFHGHTILHEPERHRTWQIGNAAQLASLAGIDVVSDFRTDDVAAGGEGAPFAPIFHAAIAPDDRPVCILNIGGVGNVTWIGAQASGQDEAVFDHMLAFDTGPGNALIDDWVSAHCGQPFDRDGAIAASGTVNAKCLATLLNNAYFDRTPPKSLDRDAFPTAVLEGLSPADGAATLTAFTIETIGRARAHLPEPPGRWVVTGGGRHNGFLMKSLASHLNAQVIAIEQIGWDGDVIEAQAFAYMAVRNLRGLPLSGPSTTGVPKPLPGGRLYRAN